MSWENLNKEKALYFKNKLREARDNALGDAEAFPQICFAIEELGSYLKGKQIGLGGYRLEIFRLIKKTGYLIDVKEGLPRYFARIESYYDVLRQARNDAMHTGVYARHATEAGKALCLVIEEALTVVLGLCKVRDFIIRNPAYIEKWQPVAFARQMMLENSYSFLPVYHEEKWHLISEMAVAKYLFGKSSAEKKECLFKCIGDAIKDEGKNSLKLIDAKVVSLDDQVISVLSQEERPHSLWIVAEKDNLIGVLSPFELM
ncbi:CBS domain-containing protein [Alcaligenes faecalis]|uniref:CBS domain-containing protein n=1 Tax=Alcaligenes faecalis TaxID=511 RepID=UPI00126A0713|nr:CBS domain-containing protein [Alcaligenes faecalis]